VWQSTCLLVQNFAKIQRNVFIEREYSNILIFLEKNSIFLKYFLGPHLDSNFSLVAFYKLVLKLSWQALKTFHHPFGMLVNNATIEN